MPVSAGGEPSVVAGRPGVRSSWASPSAIERSQSVTIALALFVLTLAVYWGLGPQKTSFDFQLSQANNLIHGHLDMTAQHTRNLGVLERVLYDGQGFCLPLDDPRGDVAAALIVNPRITAECRHYMQHSLGPAFLLVPLVLLWGLDVNQTLVSALLAALTAPLVFAITRRFSDDRRTQLALTALAMFGTILWWVGSHGGVWFFAHTTAVLFLFGAIYAALVRGNALVAAACVGAAFLCRPTTILAGPFLLIAFADRWWIADRVQPLVRRIRLRPLAELALGVAPFLAVGMAANALRFGSPFESGYNYAEQLYQVDVAWRWPHGWFDPSYLGRHPPVFWEQMPIVSNQGSYVWPSWAGLATWVSTPALFYGLFAHRRLNPTVARIGGLAIVVACAIVAARGIERGLSRAEWATAEVPLGIHLWPFWLVIAGAVAAAVVARDRLVVACWAAIIPIALTDWMFAATGWAQFGYRYALDFTPFLFVLVAVSVGRRVQWHHVALILAGIAVNLWGVLWIYHFAPAQLWGWTWVSF